MAVEITTNIGIEELHVFSDCQVNLDLLHQQQQTS